MLEYTTRCVSREITATLFRMKLCRVYIDIKISPSFEEPNKTTARITKIFCAKKKVMLFVQMDNVLNVLCMKMKGEKKREK